MTYDKTKFIKANLRGSVFKDGDRFGMKTWLETPGRESIESVCPFTVDNFETAKETLRANMNDMIKQFESVGGMSMGEEETWH